MERKDMTFNFRNRFAPRRFILFAVSLITLMSFHATGIAYTEQDVQNYMNTHPAQSGSPYYDDCYFWPEEYEANGQRGYHVWLTCNPSRNVIIKYDSYLYNVVYSGNVTNPSNCDGHGGQDNAIEPGVMVNRQRWVGTNCYGEQFTFWDISIPSSAARHDNCWVETNSGGCGLVSCSPFACWHNTPFVCAPNTTLATDFIPIGCESYHQEPCCASTDHCCVSTDPCCIDPCACKCCNDDALGGDKN